MDFLKRFRRGRVYKNALKERRRRARDESLAVIDAMMKEFREKLPFLESFRTNLIPLVHHTGRYFDRLLNSVPGPAIFDPQKWARDPLLHAMCDTEKGAADVIRASEPLHKFFQDSNSNEAFALLTAQKREKTVFGTESVGEIVRRDVIQKAVFFEELAIAMPADALEKTRRQAYHQLFYTLFSAAADTISNLNRLESELKLQHDEIAAKGALYTAENRPREIDELHQVLDKKIEDVEAALDSPEDYIAPLRELLSHPETHLTAKAVFLRLNSMGILLKEASADKSDGFSLAEFKSGSKQKWVATWVRVDRNSVAKPH